MPLPGAVPVVLSAGERAALKKRVRGAKTAHRDRLRALIVLAAARGRDNARIAADLQITVDTVRKWRRRFAVRGLGGLADLPRPGRPRRIGELDRAAVVALACQLPAATGVPLAHWTGPELAAELAVRGLARPMSASSVLRIPGRAPGQAVAVPVVDLPPRPGLRGQGQDHRGPVPGLLPGPAARPR
jgi:transposase